jgi:eukaryotic-like serine/threonine-protein kinase
MATWLSCGLLAARSFWQLQDLDGNNDLTIGRTGVLLACTLLFEAIPTFEHELRTELANFANQMLGRIWLEEQSNPTICYNGIAHGWAGLIYASLRWHRASGAAIPEHVPKCLQELGARAEPVGHGLRWQWMILQEEPTFMTGWCGGTAGLIHLWTLANLIFGDRYHEFAERAAIYTWEHQPAVRDLCCGLAGCAYGLLNLYKHTG